MAVTVTQIISKSKFKQSVVKSSYLSTYLLVTFHAAPSNPNLSHKLNLGQIQLRQVGTLYFSKLICIYPRYAHNSDISSLETASYETGRKVS